MRHGSSGYGVVFELSPEPQGGCPGGSNSGDGWCETVLYSFMSNPDGASPFAGLTWDTDGNLYGTTYGGGSGKGTVYELSPNGSGGWSESVLYSLCSQPNCADGAYPNGQVQASNGNFYATTESGGAYAAGTVFELSPKPRGGCPSGSYTGNGWCEAIIHAFAGHPKDGNYPSGTPVIDSAGNLYGTTVYGGRGNATTTWDAAPSGSSLLPVESITEKFFVLSMSGPVVIGCCFSIRLPFYPWAGVVLDASGNIYGMTEYGGSSTYCTGKWERAFYQGCGVLFELDKAAKRQNYKFEFLWVFSWMDGAHPVSSLILDGGNLYGTTYDGGLGEFCPNPDGCGVALSSLRRTQG